jgi:hypothetical protein
MFITNQKLIFINKWKFCKPSIEKWVPYDLLWALSIISEINVMKTKGNEKITFWCVHHKKGYYR